MFRFKSFVYDLNDHQMKTMDFEEAQSIYELPSSAVEVLPMSQELFPLNPIGEEPQNLINEVPQFNFCLVDGEEDDVFLPHRAHDTDTGWDVRSTEHLVVRPFQSVLVPLGIKVIAPPGWWLELRPRSSTFAVKNIHCLYGVIDEGYENQLYLAAQWIPASHHHNSSSIYEIKRGDRLGQLVPVKRQLMNVSHVTKEQFESLSANRKSERGVGGFGSSG